MNTIKAKGTTGFTLIELLIVIALLGILAVGLLAAIDPIEQIRKGQDTTVETIAKEFVEAEHRYYATKSALTTAVPIAAATALTYNNANIATLVTAGELKATYAVNSPGNVTNLGRVVISTDATTPPTLIRACYHPLSKGIHNSAAAVYTNLGVLQAAATCPSATVANNCFICLN